MFTNCNHSVMSMSLSMNDKQIGCDCHGIDIKNTHTHSGVNRSNSKTETALQETAVGCVVPEALF